MIDGGLRTALGTCGATAQLKSGAVAPRGFRLEFEEVPQIVQAFRSMVRNLEFDVCEMALSTYLCARAHGTRFTALPVFVVRAFHHGALFVRNTDRAKPLRALEGRRVGVSGGYTTTTGMWVRAWMQEEHGVDLDKVTWVLSGDEHVTDYQPPANVTSSDGRALAGLLLDGEIDALVGADPNHPDIVAYVMDGQAAGLHALRTRGHYPINHLVVVRDELLSQNPALAGALTEAFGAARQAYVASLGAAGFAPHTPEQHLHKAVMDAGFDPLPYGVSANRQMLQAAIDHAHRQRIIPTRPAPDALFATP